jgi:hypothetical protein
MNDEVKVIEHEAVGHDDPLPATRDIAEKREKIGAIAVLPIDGLAVVAAAAHVVDPTGNDFA